MDQHWPSTSAPCRCRSGTWCHQGKPLPGCAPQRPCQQKCQQGRAAPLHALQRSHGLGRLRQAITHATVETQGGVESLNTQQWKHKGGVESLFFLLGQQETTVTAGLGTGLDTSWSQLGVSWESVNRGTVQQWRRDTVCPCRAALRQGQGLCMQSSHHVWHPPQLNSAGTLCGPSSAPTTVRR